MAWWFFPRSSSSSSSKHHKPGYARSSSGFSSYSRSSTSHYKRRPRDGYVDRLVHKFKHLIRELWYYLRRNPIKVFFLVIMPLISGGALAAFAKQFGIRLPAFLSGKHAKGMGESGGYYGSKGYGGGAEDLLGSAGGLGSLLGGGGVGNLMGVAKMFL